MRIARRGALILCSVAICLVASGPARAQEDEVLLPEQSAAKAKGLLEKMIQALGGSAYLNVRDSVCTGKLGLFDHSGALTGYGSFTDYTKQPDKDRLEEGKKGTIVQIYSGNHGWELDRGGVTDAPEDSIQDNQRELQVDFDYILRYRLKEPGMNFRYAGPDIVDLKEADWVELTDPQGREIRIAIAKSTHLPIRRLVVSRDPVTHVRAEEVDYFSNFHPVDGVMMPFQITRLRNGMKEFQVFYQGCKYNTGLSHSLFTKQSLEQRWAQVGKKHKK